jgi:hypothetical protein
MDAWFFDIFLLKKYPSEMTGVFGFDREIRNVFFANTARLSAGTSDKQP